MALYEKEVDEHTCLPLSDFPDDFVCCRYQLFLQLKQDLLSGQLECPFDVASELAAYSLQCKYETV